MGICKNCGTSVDGNFCPACGKRYEEGQTNFCQKCGEKLTGNGDFCTHCGASVRDGNLSKVSNVIGLNGQHSQNKQILYFLNWGLFLAILVIFLCCPVFEASSGSKDEIERYNFFYYGNVPEEMTLYEMTTYMYDSLGEYFEYVNEGGEADQSGFLMWYVALVLMAVAYVVTIGYYIYVLVKFPINRESVVQGGTAFCAFSIVVAVLYFLFIQFGINGLTEEYNIKYEMNPMIIVAAVLAIIKWKIAIEKFNDEAYRIEEMEKQ